MRKAWAPLFQSILKTAAPDPKATKWILTSFQGKWFCLNIQFDNLLAIPGIILSNNFTVDIVRVLPGDLNDKADLSWKKADCFGCIGEIMTA